MSNKLQINIIQYKCSRENILSYCFSVFNFTDNNASVSDRIYIGTYKGTNGPNLCIYFKKNKEH